VSSLVVKLAYMRKWICTTVCRRRIAATRCQNGMRCYELEMGDM